MLDLDTEAPAKAEFKGRTRTSKREQRLKYKRIYQQEYRDKRKGKLDSRRLAVAALTALLELDAAHEDSHHYDYIFDLASARVPAFYERKDVAKLVKKLRGKAYDEHEDARLARESNERY